MKKRCFPRYDVDIDARCRVDDAPGHWQSCRITKISRKGIGVIFPAATPPPPNALLTFSLPNDQESEAILLRGALKWTREFGGSTAGGVELNAIVGETQWLQLIYFIRRPCDEKQVGGLKCMPDQAAVKKNLHPAPAKVVMPGFSAMDHIRNILNYKIL